MLSKADLFARLAEGHAASVTVVTPNKRLSQALMAEFDASADRQGPHGLGSARHPAVRRLRRAPVGGRALYRDLGEKLPLLLTPAQEQHLWEEVLAKSDLLIVPQAAAQCREAWRLMHQWRIRPGSGNEDLQAFAQWAAAYAQRTSGEVDAARLPDLMAQHLLKKPKLLVAYGFDVMPPQTAEFLAKFEHAFCMPEPVDGQCMRTSYPSAKHEIEAAAKWARARLEEGKTQIGVVVPDLGKRRAEVQRVFSRVMQPGYNLPGRGEDADAVQRLAGQAAAQLSPGGRRAQSHRARVARRGLRGREPRHPLAVPRPRRRRALAPRHARREAAQELRRDGVARQADRRRAARAAPAERRSSAYSRSPRRRPDSPAEWARHFSALLEAAGFPGERVLDSDEFQTRAKWHEALGELAKLERISQKFSFDDALAFLKRHCTDTLFQPESPDAPIQILGVLESAGLRFDCLWVSGLTDEAWPLDARPNPFLPIAAQKKAGIPQASAETAAAYDRSITEGWKRAAPEVVFSWPLKEEDRDFAPSPLISDVSPRRRRLHSRITRATAICCSQPESWKPSRTPRRLPSRPAKCAAARACSPTRRRARSARSRSGASAPRSWRSPKPASTRATAARWCTR